jgi:uncharacterized SAM-binding protein YcdF (DUF218 family)
VISHLRKLQKLPARIQKYFQHPSIAYAGWHNARSTIAGLIDNLFSMVRMYRLIRKFWVYVVSGLVLVPLSLIPIRLGLASFMSPEPDAILVLGGGHDRVQAAAKLAKYYPTLEVWVSSGGMPEDVYAAWQEVDISTHRLHLDYRASDTVTNFTTLIPDFKTRNINHLYLVTSNFHMPRAKVIATLILGSQGIAFTPVSVPSIQRQEPFFKIVRDGSRAILWIFTNRAGSRFKPSYEP